MAFELRDFRLLEAIQETGSISAAAQSIGYSQSAASQQLRRAERDLGIQLVVRDGRTTTLTEAGRSLASSAPQMLSQAARVLSDARLLAADGPEVVRVATFSSVANALLPVAFRRMQRRVPGVTFRLREGETERCLSLLVEGETDLAVVYTWPSPSAPSVGIDSFPGIDSAHYELVPICREPVLIALPEEGRGPSEVADANLSEFRDARWIAGCPICRQGLVDACARSGFTPGIGFETDDYHAMLSLVESGMGCALVTELMVRSARHSYRVRLRRCRPAQFRVVTAVVSRAAAQTGIVRGLIRELRAASGPLATL